MATLIEDFGRGALGERITTQNTILTRVTDVDGHSVFVADGYHGQGAQSIDASAGRNHSSTLFEFSPVAPAVAVQSSTWVWITDPATWDVGFVSAFALSGRAAGMPTYLLGEFWVYKTTGLDDVYRIAFASYPSYAREEFTQKVTAGWYHMTLDYQVSGTFDGILTSSCAQSDGTVLWSDTRIAKPGGVDLGFNDVYAQAISDANGVPAVKVDLITVTYAIPELVGEPGPTRVMFHKRRQRQERHPR